MYTNLQAYRQAITTLTQLDKEAVKQKFYTVSIPDYIQIDTGNGAFADSIFKWVAYENATDGFDGFQDDNTNQARMPRTSVGYNGRTDFRHLWNKYCSYNIKDLEQLRVALERGETNFDFIGDILESRKRNFDLMMQDCVFLGNKVFEDCKGLLNNDEVAIDTEDLTQSLSSMTAQELQAIVGTLLRAYTKQSEYTATPNRLLIPYSDFLGLSTSSSAEFPIKTKLEYLEEGFKGATMNSDFKILPVVYAQSEYNQMGKNIYCLYNKSPEVMVFDLPVEYQTTAFNTADNYTFYNVGYGQVGGVRIFRPQEVLYLTF